MLLDLACASPPSRHAPLGRAIGRTMASSPVATRTFASILLQVVVGGILGAISWWLAWVVSGTFEPFDSSTGLLVNQAVLVGAVVLIGCRYSPGSAASTLVGDYLGLQ